MLMKPLYGTTIMAVVLVIATSCLADKLFTWTDAQGVTHITETPPPPNARGQNVLEYRPRTDDELKAIDEEKRAFNKQLETKAANQKAINARSKAQQADQRAAEDAAAADAAQKKADEFTKQARTNWRRYQRNKATIMRLEDETQAARQKAEDAKESAQSAAERAVDADERAKALRMENSDTTAESEMLPDQR